MTDYPKEKRSWVMSQIKSRDTTPELLLRRKLWAEGLRYRKEVKELPGKPDIMFNKAKLVVFVDGRFWHGKKLSEARLSRMSPYWQKKISGNVARDEENNRLLKEMGYAVLRFTDADVLYSVDAVVRQIKSQLQSR